MSSEVIGAVLAGGRGRRMGKDKLAMELAGKTLLERALDALIEAGMTPVVILRQDQREPATPAGTQVLRDEVEDAGPLGGIHALLRWLPVEWALAVPSDQPFLVPKLLRGLIGQESDDLDAVVGRSPSGIEPLPGAYRRTCLPAVEETLAAGERSLLQLFSRIRVREVPTALLREWDPPLRSYVNINSPADLARAQALASSSDARKDEDVGR